MLIEVFSVLSPLQEGEISADLYTFHEAVSQLQLQEDDVLDTHKSVLEASQRWHDIDCRLLADTRDVDYDQDGRPLLHSTLDPNSQPVYLPQSSMNTQNLPAASKVACGYRPNSMTRAQSQSRIPSSHVQSGKTVRSKSQNRIPENIKEASKSLNRYSLQRSQTCTIRSPWVNNSSVTISNGVSPSTSIHRTKSQSRIGDFVPSARPQFEQKTLKTSAPRRMTSLIQHVSSVQRPKSQTGLVPTKGSLSAMRMPLSPLVSNRHVQSIAAKFNQSGHSFGRSSSGRSDNVHSPKRTSTLQAAPLRKCWSQVGLNQGTQYLHPAVSPQSSPPIKRAKSQVGLPLVNERHCDDVPVSLKMLDDDASLPSWYYKRQLMASVMSDSTPSLTPSDDSMNLLVENKSQPPQPDPFHHSKAQYPLRMSSTEKCNNLLRPLKKSFPPERLRFLQDGNPQGGESCEEDSVGDLKSQRMHGKSLISDTAQPSLPGGIIRRCKELALSILLNLIVYLFLPFLYSLLVLYVT